MILQWLLAMMTLTIFGSCRWERRHPYPLPKKKPPLTVIIPCYNDGDSIEDTITSLFACYPAELLHCIVINDASTDSSAAVIAQLQRRYPLIVRANETNQGKVASVNAACLAIQTDYVLFLDADVTVNPEALNDMLARLENPRLGAVSCPYQPSNNGFWARMQAIEYDMLRWLQGSYNNVWAISLWWGCHMVKTAALKEVNYYRPEAITEDMDLAFRLTKAGRIVHQSLIPIKTIVPDTFAKRWKQKKRWNSWGTQCFITYRRIWIKHPLHLIFMVIFQYIWVSRVWWLIQTMALIALIHELWWLITLFQIRWPTILWWWLIFLGSVINKIWFMSFSAPYVWFANRDQGWKRLLWIFPYTIIYTPLFFWAWWWWLYLGIRVLINEKQGIRWW